MASPSTFSPNKSTSQTSYPDILDLKWTKKVSRHSHQTGIKTRLLTDIPAEDSSRNEVLLGHPPLGKQDLNLDRFKIIFKLPPPGSKEHKAPVVEEEAEGENPNPENADAVVAAALAAQEAEEVVTKTWNLRPRKPRKPVRNPNRDATGAAGAQNNRNPGVGRSRPARVPQSKKPPEPRMEISLTLTKEEIEEDFLRMTGKKPARRPKMRLKNVQKQLDILTPGQLYLDDISAHGSQQAKLNKGSD
uniref:uncharacterized protein LOC105352894 n=1 Tax=Fragaria vesca subsp. vesca TaxID=101020 RepID=UPI0005C990D3|nr:PREDICTED: uncharacterized protein LOC105352894 [Fragaria vesca subsp. vesca]